MLKDAMSLHGLIPYFICSDCATQFYFHLNLSYSNTHDHPLLYYPIHRVRHFVIFSSASSSDSRTKDKYVFSIIGFCYR